MIEGLEKLLGSAEKLLDSVVEALEDEDSAMILMAGVAGATNTLLLGRSIRRSAAVISKLRAGEPLTRKDASALRALLMTSAYAVAAQAASARRQALAGAEASDRKRKRKARKATDGKAG